MAAKKRKPKFRVGQVVVLQKRVDTTLVDWNAAIVDRRPRRNNEGNYEYLIELLANSVVTHNEVTEEHLRPLTAREIGPRKGKR